MVHRFDLRPTCRGKQSSAVRAVRVNEGSVDDPCACRFSFGSSRHSKRTGKMKFVLDASAEACRFYYGATLEVKLHQNWICLKMFWPEIGFHRTERRGGGKRGKRGRDYSTLDYTSGCDYFHSAEGPSVHGAKGRRAGTHGLRHQFICEKLLLLRSNLGRRKQEKQQTAGPPAVKSYQRRRTAGAREPRGPSSFNRCCVCGFLGRGGSECAAAADVTPVLCVVAANAGEEMPA